MKKLLVILFVVVSPAIWAQELLMPDLPEIDSLEVETHQETLNRQLFPGTYFPVEMMQPLQIPEIDFNAALSERWSFDVSDDMFSPVNNSLFLPGFSGNALMPFINSGSVFSSAAYKVSDRFSVGGYSYGANSVFTAPLPNNGINNYDFRGSTLFMKYNVTKNFKIETRVNVTHGSHPGL